MIRFNGRTASLLVTDNAVVLYTSNTAAAKNAQSQKFFVAMCFCFLVNTKFKHSKKFGQENLSPVLI